MAARRLALVLVLVLVLELALVLALALATAWAGSSNRGSCFSPGGILPVPSLA